MASATAGNFGFGREGIVGVGGAEVAGSWLIGLNSRSLSGLGAGDIGL